MALKWSDVQEKEKYQEYSSTMLRFLSHMDEQLNEADHAPVKQLIKDISKLDSYMMSDSKNERQESLILYREAFAFLRIYLFKPEQVKYYLEHDLNQTHFLKNFLN